MEIQEQNGLFLVVQNGENLYEAQTQDEAQGYIDWINRGSDAGSNDGCVNCP